MDILKQYKDPGDNDSYRPELFRLQNIEDKRKFEELFKGDASFFVYDEMDGQLRELVKCLNPHLRITPEDYPDLVLRHLSGCSMEDYGVWVYYPWSKKMVHILDEEEFVEVRTNRNKYKLTTEEQKKLSHKKIGIIGLSVGQSIALTIAMERICGELRLADFDTAELSNLNRIRTGLANLGMKKTIIAAREIAEIDPFLNVVIFNDGLHKDNIEAFFTGNGKLDLLVEVCDGLDIKILSRFKARDLQIPVVMDTNDRGMIDVERFDLEPDRPILHGLAGDLNPENIKDLSNEQKIPYIFKMVGVDTLSTRLKAAMIEVSQSINTWPQLASSVVLGGALTTDVARRILLDQYHDSGRYYVDPEELIADVHKSPTASMKSEHTIIDEATMRHIAERYVQNDSNGYEPGAAEIEQMIHAATLAPAYNNTRYCSHYYTGGILFLFLNNNNVNDWDGNALGINMSIGAMLENIHLKAAALSLKDEVHLSPLKGEKRLIATITFTKSEPADTELVLADNISTRYTERKFIPSVPLPIDFFKELQYFVKAEERVQVLHTEKEEDIKTLASIVGDSHRLQILNEQGHNEYYNSVNWNNDAATPGIPLREMGLSEGEVAGYSVAKDWKAVSLLSKWDKGNAFKLMAMHKASVASSMVLLLIKGNDEVINIKAGRVMERVWLYACSRGVAVQPIIAPALLFNKLSIKDIFSTKTEGEIKMLKDKLSKIFLLDKEHEGDTQVFLMKLVMPAPTVES